MGWKRAGLVRVCAGALGLGLMLAACGGGTQEQEGESEGPTTLRLVWFEWPPAQILEDFANENYPDKNVRIQVETVPLAQWHDSIFTQFAAEETDFDIAVLDSQFIGEAVQGEHILDITDFANENINLSGYPPNLLAAYGQYPEPPGGEFDPDASVHGLPLLGDTWVLVYRKDLVGNQPPGSWDEMLDAARQCERDNPGTSGLAFHGANDYDVASTTLNTLIWINGGEIWDPDSKKIDGVINDQTGQQAVTELAEELVPLAPRNVGTSFISEVNAAISQNQACMGLNWVAGLEGIQDPSTSTLGDTEEEILDKLGFAPLPCGDTCAKPLGGQGMHVSSYSDNQDEALDFFGWFAKPETQRAWAEAGGVPTTTKALASKAFLESRPWNAALSESVPDLRDFWRIPEYARLLDIHTSTANAIITGVQDPQQALDELARKEQRILDEAEGGEL